MIDREQLVVTSRAQWRSWLAANAGVSSGVWVVTYRSSTGRPAPSVEDIVEEALCFGWIDSTRRVRDEETSMLLVTPRRPRSTWSAPNKERVERLIAAGQMTPPGLRAVDVARANGSWELLDPVDRLEVPDDLADALASAPCALAAYEAMPPSTRKRVLWWVISARRPETRARRIAHVVAALREGRSPVP